MSSDKYGNYEDNPSEWLRKIREAHWAEMQEQAKKPKKTVWALVSIEIDDEGDGDDETFMDFVHEELVAYGFTIDDMGMVDPTDLDKFYPEETK